MGEVDLSVVIPARDEEQRIRGALGSAAAQTWPAQRLEAIVVVNGSTDGTADAARAFARERPDLNLQVIEDPIPGRSRAKNRGAGAASGRGLLFLDADSRMAPDLVERTVRRLDAGQLAGSIAVVADGGDWLDRGFFALMELGKRQFGIRAQMLYCERALFSRHGGFAEELHLAEDLDLLNRLRQSGIAVCHVEESSIATSPRRLHDRPLRLGMLVMFGRWALAQRGIGRRWQY